MLSGGSITYRVINVYTKGFDGDEEYVRLREKIDNGEPLNEEDILKVIFLPLMKSKSSEAEMTFQAAELAKTIPGEMGTFVLGVLVTLGDRFLSEEQKKKLMEVLSMTAIAQCFREERELEIAKAALRKGSPVEFVVEITGLPRETVLRLKSEVEQEHGSAPGASQFSAGATVQSSGGVVISWQDPGTQAVGGLMVNITGSDDFSDQGVQFTAGQVTDPKGQSGTTYTVTAMGERGSGAGWVGVGDGPGNRPPTKQDLMDAYRIM